MRVSDYIMKVPVVSMHHLTEEDLEYLQELADADPGEFPRVAYYNDVGWYVWLIICDIDEIALSEGVKEIFRRHFVTGDHNEGDTCAIRFDVDGCELEGIPIRQEAS